jgi:hypothetical protein
MTKQKSCESPFEKAEADINFDREEFSDDLCVHISDL